MRKTGRTRTAIYDVFTYDVWGNEEDGYEVNDVYPLARGVEVKQEEAEYNGDTPHPFIDWDVPDKEIIKALNIKPRTAIEVNGEDGAVLYVEASADCYPLGELHFVGLKDAPPSQA